MAAPKEKPLDCWGGEGTLHCWDPLDYDDLRVSGGPPAHRQQGRHTPCLSEKAARLLVHGVATWGGFSVGTRAGAHGVALGNQDERCNPHTVSLPHCTFWSVPSTIPLAATRGHLDITRLLFGQGAHVCKAHRIVSDGETLHRAPDAGHGKSKQTPERHLPGDAPDQVIITAAP